MSTSPDHAADFFVLRAPLLPQALLERWGEDLLASQGRKDPDSVSADRAALRARLEQLLTRPEVGEALRVASGSLKHGLEAWRADPESRRGQRAEHALVRYLARMASRPTPFGLYASTARGRVGERTQLRVGAPRRRTRLDAGALSELEAELVRDPEIRANVPFQPNPSLYPMAGELRYIEAVQTGGLRQYRLAALEPDEALQTALSLAPGTPGALTSALAERWPEQDTAEITDFVQTLIEQSVLVPALGAPLTGPEPLRALAESLIGCGGAAGRFGVLLERLNTAILALDSAELVPTEAALEALRAALEPLSPVLGGRDLSRLLQVDLGRDHAGTLGPEVVREVQTAVATLHAWRPGRPDADLERFIEAFQERWGAAEVPLLDALDEENGLGFGGAGEQASSEPLLAELRLGRAPSGGLSLAARELRLLTALMRAPGSRVLDLATLGPADPEPGAPPLPEAYAAVGSLLAASEEAVARGAFQVLMNTTNGPSGANLLGRFCDLDPGLLAAVQAHHAAEEARHPDVIFAEVVHQPEGRLGNVLQRPLLRGWEIPFLGRSGAPEDRQIPLADLRVRLEGGRVVLRSQRLNREVLPRLCSAYTVRHASSQSVLRFLGAVQRQGLSAFVAWSWGALSSLPFLPRVVSGRAILEPARWRLDRDQLLALDQPDPAGRLQAVAALRQALDLPRVVVLEQDDNLLSVDLENSLSVDAFVDAVAGQAEARIVERLAGPEALLASGVDGAGVTGRYTHEFILPFLRATPAPARATPHLSPPAAAQPTVWPAVQRSFLPGEGWVTLKLYTGPATADRLLREVVAPLVAEARDKGWAQGWFFLRYGDPDWHLRLRFRGEGQGLCGPLLSALHARLQAHPGLARRLVVDGYERELERYGGPRAIEAVEALFQADSEAVLDALPVLDPDERWLFAAAGLSLILGRLGLDPEARVAVLSELRGSFGREFGVDRAVEQQLSARHRALRPRLQSLPEALPAPARAALQRLGEDPAWSRINELEEDLPGLAAHIAPGLLHMHANRVLRARARAQELVLYDLLSRELRSDLARRRAS